MERISLTEHLPGYVARDGTEYVFANTDHLAEMIAFLNDNKHVGLHVSRAIGPYRSKDLAFVSQCKNLPYLYIQDGVEDISAIQEIVGLRRLTILEDIVWNDFSAWKELASFYGVYDKSIVNIADSDSLRSLTFRKVSTRTQTINDMFLPPDVEEIVFTRGNLTGLDGIQKCRKIKRIELNYFPKLVDMSALLDLPQLEELSLESCKQAVDLQVIGKLQSLKRLKLTNCGELDSLDFLLDLEHLEFFTFVDTKINSCDLSPLTRHPSLGYAGFMSSRHYNFSFDQIQEILQKNK